MILLNTFYWLRDKKDINFQIGNCIYDLVPNTNIRIVAYEPKRKDRLLNSINFTQLVKGDNK